MGVVVLGRVSTKVPPGRLAAWALLIAAVGSINLAARLAGGRPESDVLYRYSTAVSSLVLYGVILGVVLLIARGLDPREVFALQAPPSLKRAAGYVVGGFVAILAVNAVLSPFLHAGKEQGLVPDRWEPSHAGAFAANFAVVVLVAPLVEELTFRGFGVGALSGYVPVWAVVLLVGLAFGAWHGLVIAFPALASLGAIFAFVRVKTRSVYPTMVMHAIFNAGALLIAVTVKVGS
jgi:membrane protease YdiL (CAAX protease family)